jgi:hypothetical protein
MAPDMHPITLVLTKDGGEIKRQFIPSLGLTNFGKALKKLDRETLEAEFPGVPLPELNPGADIFQKPQDVPWYLDKIGRELFNNRNRKKKRYQLQVKACEGFLYIRLKVQTGRKWKLLIRPFFQGSPWPKSPDERESTRGFADTLLFAAPKLLKEKQGKGAGELLKWYNIDIKARCTKFEPKRKRLTLAFAPDVDIFPNEVDPDKKTIDIEAPDGSRVLVASRNVRLAIEELAEVWHNPIPRSVLLSAWTGSGKEVLKSVFLYACRVPKHRVIEFAAPELAALDDQWEPIIEAMRSRKLFDAKGKDKKVSAHSILFLDEIHHPEVAKLRSGLLRGMETNRIADGNEEVETNLLTYLFAASKSPERLRELPPPDFWNRLEYNVVMRHPLLLDARCDRNEALRQYFCFFWRKTAEKRKEPNDEETYLNALRGYNAVSELADKFVEVLGSPLIPMISMRTIRSIVARLFGRALFLGQTQQPAPSELVTKIKGQFDEWTTEICRQIVPELKPEGLF